jgi:hypothetical protein
MEEIDYSKIGGVIEEIRETDFIAGTIPYEVVCEDWKPYLPNPERQKRANWDTMSCVTFSALNVLETQLNFMLATGQIEKWAVEQLIEMGYIVDGQFNFSERFTAVMSGTTDMGNSLQNVWDSIRHDGLLPERDCPYTDTMTKAQYFKKDFTAAQIEKAKLMASVLEDGSESKFISIQYGWVITNSFRLVEWEFDEVKANLKQCPLQFVTPTSNWGKTPCTPNENETQGSHATMNWKTVEIYDIEDHYLPFLKQLSRDYYIRYAMKAVVTLNQSIKKSMTNIKLVRNSVNKDEMAFLLPVMSPEALKSLGLNFDKEIPVREDGSVNWEALKTDGTYTIN